MLDVPSASNTIGRQMVCRASRVVAVCVWLVLAASAGRAQDDVAGWLASGKAGLERYDPDVVARRRTDDFTRQLIRAALDAGLPRGVRERAVLLLGAVSEEPLVEKVLREELQAEDLRWASDSSWMRIGARRQALASLAQLADVAEGRDEAAVAAARSLDGLAIQEACALARDPLFPRAAAMTRVVGAALPHDPSVDEVLVAVAAGGRADARAAALAGLARRGRPPALAAGVVAALVAAAERGDEAQRKAAEEAVALLASDEAVQAFCRRAFAAEVPEAARVLAARGVGRAGLAAAAPWLKGQQRGTGSEMQVAVATALVRLGNADPTIARALLEAALATSGVEARDAFDGLQALPTEQRDALLRAALDDAEPDRRLRALEFCYAAAPPSLSAPLAAVAGDGDAPWQARHMAVLALGRIGGPGAHAALTAILGVRERSADAAVLRRAAAAALEAAAPVPDARDDPAARAARAALEAALDERDVLERGDDAPLRCAALDALGAWGDPRSGAVVAQALAGPARGTRERIARVRACARLGVLDAATAARVLALPAEDPDPELALAVLGYSRAIADRLVAIPAALELLSHRARGVRLAAGAELRRRRGGAGPEVGDEGAPVFSQEHTAALRAWKTWWEREPRPPR